MTDDTYTSQPLTETYNRSMRTNHANPVRRMDGEPTRRELGMSHRNEKPTVWSAVQYPSEEAFTFDSFWLRYERQAEARAIVDKPAQDAWQEPPDIVDRDTEEEEDATTRFEEAIEELFDGEHTRRMPTHRFTVAHKLARLGEYSVMVLGFADGRDFSQPIQGVGDDEETGEFSDMDEPLEALNYVATFGQDRIIDWELDTDLTSPRYNLPETYEIQVRDPEDEDADVDISTEEYTEEVHWSRVVHIPQGTLEDDLRGTPVLKPVFHELLNIDKIKAASGEGYWRGGYQGMVVSPPQGPRGQDMQFEDGGDAVAEQIQEFVDNYRRTITTTGNVESIDPNIGDPTPHLNAQYNAIEVALDIPRTQFVGADRADTADSTNQSQWHSTVGHIRNDFCEPVILEPFVQRLIDVGILPEPTGDGFTVEWQPLDELSEQEEAEILNTEAQAMAAVSPSNDVLTHWTTEEVRERFGDPPERGTAVDEEYQPDEDEEELEVDEAALQRMEEQAAQPAPDEFQGGEQEGQQTDDGSQQPPGQEAGD